MFSRIEISQWRSGQVGVRRGPQALGALIVFYTTNRLTKVVRTVAGTFMPQANCIQAPAFLLRKFPQRRLFISSVKLMD